MEKVRYRTLALEYKGNDCDAGEIAIETYPKAMGRRMQAFYRMLPEKIHTHTGLKVTVDVLDKVYEARRKAAEHLKSALKIARNTLPPKWNYNTLPRRMQPRE